MAQEWQRFAYHLSQPSWEQFLTWTIAERQAQHERLSENLDSIEADFSMRSKDMRR